MHGSEKQSWSWSCHARSGAYLVAHDGPKQSAHCANLLRSASSQHPAFGSAEVSVQKQNCRPNSSGAATGIVRNFSAAHKDS